VEWIWLKNYSAEVRPVATLAIRPRQRRKNLANQDKQIGSSSKTGWRESSGVFGKDRE
jgi:hypothetical protein